MPDRILVEESAAPVRELVVEPGPDQALWLLCWIGGLLALAGWMDVLLLWIPSNFGRPEWEFGTVSSTFDALPLGTIGVAILIAAAVARGWRRMILVGGVASLVMAVVLVAALVLFALDVPLAWKGVADAYRSALKKAMFKTAILGVIYITLYAVTGVVTLRRVTGARRAKREAR